MGPNTAGYSGPSAFRPYHTEQVAIRAVRAFVRVDFWGTMWSDRSPLGDEPNRRQRVGRAAVTILAADLNRCKRFICAWLELFACTHLKSVLYIASRKCRPLVTTARCGAARPLWGKRNTSLSSNSKCRLPATRKINLIRDKSRERPTLAPLPIRLLSKGGGPAPPKQHRPALCTVPTLASTIVAGLAIKQRSINPPLAEGGADPQTDCDRTSRPRAAHSHSESTALWAGGPSKNADPRLGRRLSIALLIDTNYSTTPRINIQFCSVTRCHVAVLCGLLAQRRASPTATIRVRSAAVSLHPYKQGQTAIASTFL